MEPHNDPLSPTAKALLAQHRDQTSPHSDEQDEVWSRVQHSLFAGAAAAAGSQGLVDPGSAVGGAAGKASAVGGASAKAGAVGGASAKAGILGSTALKITVSAGLLAGGTAVLEQERIVDAYAPAVRVTPRIEPSQTDLERPAQVAPAPAMQDQRLPMAARVPPSPVFDTPVDPLPAPKAKQSAFVLEMTPALAAQMQALSRIDDAIRGSSFARADRDIASFRQSYAQSPFLADLDALEMVLSCRAGRGFSKQWLEFMLSSARYRRYKSRLARACQR